MTKAQKAKRKADDVPDEAHHLLSSKEVVIMLDAEFKANGHPNLMAASAKYQLNGASNGIFLPAFFGHQMKVNRQRHKGNHRKKYYSAVEEIVRPIYEKFDGQNLCKDPVAKAQFLDKMKSAESNVRGKVSRRSLWLYDWSQPLWKSDYKDEGTGNLNVKRDPDFNAETGMDWLNIPAGQPRRRWLEQGKNKRKVVNKKWYDDQGYPLVVGYSNGAGIPCIVWPNTFAIKCP